MISRNRAAEIDASYAAYDEHPLDEADDWGDLRLARLRPATSLVTGRAVHRAT